MQYPSKRTHDHEKSTSFNCIRKKKLDVIQKKRHTLTYHSSFSKQAKQAPLTPSPKPVFLHKKTQTHGIFPKIIYKQEVGSEVRW